MVTISRPNPRTQHTARRKRDIVPASRILRDLGIGPAELAADTVVVNAVGLRRLLAEFARQQPFDPDFYSETYPDIEAARLAGLVADLHTHFTELGFLEGRLPAEPEFDPVWYAQHYPDLASVIPAHDTAGLRNHFLSAGLTEGRSGSAASLDSV